MSLRTSIIGIFLLVASASFASPKIYFLTGHREKEMAEQLYNSAAANDIRNILGHRGYELLIDNKTSLIELLEYIANPDTVAIIWYGHSTGAGAKDNLWVYDPATNEHVVVTEEMVDAAIATLPTDYCASENLAWINMGICNGADSRDFYMKIFGLSKEKVSYWAWDRSKTIDDSLSHLKDRFMTFVQRLPQRNGYVAANAVPSGRRKLFARLTVETADLFSPLLFVLNGTPIGGPDFNYNRSRQDKLGGFLKQDFLIPLSLLKDKNSLVLVDPYKNKTYSGDDYLIKGMRLSCNGSGEQKPFFAAPEIRHYGDNSRESILKQINDKTWPGAHTVTDDWVELSGPRLELNVAYENTCDGLAVAYRE